MTERLKQRFDKKGLTLSVSESLTGGMIQSKIVSVSGSSSYFQGGLTAYNIDQKVNLLGVDREVAEPVDCVSEEVARQMALGCQKLFNSDVSIGITGYADGESPHCYFAICVKGDILDSHKFVPPSGMDRNSNREYFADMAITLLDYVIKLYK